MLQPDPRLHATPSPVTLRAPGDAYRSVADLPTTGQPHEGAAPDETRTTQTLAVAGAALPRQASDSAHPTRIPGRAMRDQPLLATGPMLSTPPPTSVAPGAAPAVQLPNAAVVAQVVAALQSGGGAQLQIALAPEELGQVRLSLIATDGGLHVAIQSERPETLDLLRRNIAQLEEELRALGYASVSFGFTTDHRERPATRDGHDRPAAGNDDALPASEVQVPRTDARAQQLDGLDLRL